MGLHGKQASDVDVTRQKSQLICWVDPMSDHVRDVVSESGKSKSLGIFPRKDTTFELDGCWLGGISIEYRLGWSTPAERVGGVMGMQQGLKTRL